MRKLLACGLSAVMVALATCRPADAWVNAKFSIGLNWHFQSGNNNFLWGFYRNGQVPYDSGHGNLFDYGPAPGQQPFPWFGSTKQQNMPQAAAAGTQQAYGNTGYGNYYYPASYQPGSVYPYYYPNYYNDQFTWFYQR